MSAKLGVLCTHPIQYFAPLFRYLAQKDGLDVTVFYCQKPNSEQQGAGFGVSFNWDIDLTSGYKHVWLKNRCKNPSLIRFGGCDTPEISSIIKQERFDAFLIFGWYYKSMWQAMRACWKTHTPILVRGDSHLYTKRLWAKKLMKKFIYPYFIKRFSSCLAVGKWPAEYFAHYGARRIIQSPHFVDNKWFAEEATKHKSASYEIRKEWNIPEKSTVFLYVGKFEKIKRPMDILEALKKVIAMGNLQEAVYLLMVGDGVLRRCCEDFARDNSLPVTFTGFLNQSRIPRAYAVSDILVLPGCETWGLVVNEAMACGLPAIVSDRVGCGPDLIKEGKTGFIFAWGDIDALAGRMKEVINGATISEMGRAVKEKIVHYSVDRAAWGVLEAVDLAIREKKGIRCQR